MLFGNTSFGVLMQSLRAEKAFVVHFEEFWRGLKSFGGLYRFMR